MAAMRLEIITAEKVVYSDEVETVLVPGIEGELGVLSHHAALMTTLKPGELMVRKDGQESYLAVTGGSWRSWRTTSPFWPTPPNARRRLTRRGPRQP